MNSKRCRNLILASLLLLSSCKGTPPDASSRISSSSPVSSSGISSSGPVSPSSSTKPASLFDEETDSNLFLGVGQYRSLIPVFPADSYSSRVTEEDGISTCEVCCSGYQMKNPLESYSLILMHKGYTVRTGDASSQAMTRADVDSILALTYLLKDDDFYFSCYLYFDKQSTWPEKEVQSVLGGKDIPHPNADYYSYATGKISENVKAIQVSCFSDNPDYTLSYKALLETNQYTVTKQQNDDGEYYQAISKDQTVAIAFAYNEDPSYFLIQACLYN